MALGRYLLWLVGADSGKNVVDPIDELQRKLDAFASTASHHLVEHIAIDRCLTENRAYGMFDGQKPCRED